MNQKPIPMISVDKMITRTDPVIDLKLAKMGQTRHELTAAFAMHDSLARKGDMHLTDFSEYLK